MWPATVTPWAWAVAAVVIAFLELPVPGSYLIWIACAAGLTALAGFVIGWSLSAQLTFFVESTWYRRRTASSPTSAPTRRGA